MPYTNIYGGVKNLTNSPDIAFQYQDDGTPWPSISAAHHGVQEAYRADGKIRFIDFGDGRGKIEHWYNGGIDIANLVPRYANLESAQAYVDELNEIKELTDQNRIVTDENRLAIENLTLQIGLGTPKGTFSNIAALISANPDHLYIYLTTDNGHWNYHDGSTFVSGGVYQAPLGVVQVPGTSTSSVPSQKMVTDLDFLTNSKLRSYSYPVVTGLDAINDVINKVVKELYLYVRPGYVSAGNFVVAVLRKNIPTPNILQVAVFEVNGAGAIVPGNAVRLNFDITGYTFGILSNPVKVYEGTGGTDFDIDAVVDPGAVNFDFNYTPLTNTIINNKCKDINLSPVLKLKVLEAAYARFINKGAPVTIPTTGENNLKQFDANGVIGVSAAYDLTDYIPVTANTDYRLTQPTAPYSIALCFFNSAKVSIGRFNGPGGAMATPVQDFKTPDNCAYIVMYKRQISGNLIYNYSLITLIMHVDNGTGVSYPVRNLTRDLVTPIDNHEADLNLIKPNYLKIVDKAVAIPVLHTGVNDLKQFSSLGVVEPSTQYDLKDYVPVTANTDYRLSQPAAPYGQRICFFDADKNPLGRFNQAGGGVITTPVQDFRTPANCAFVGLYHRTILGNQVYNYVLTPLNVLYIENASGSYSYPVKNLTDVAYDALIASQQADLNLIKPNYLRIVDKAVAVSVLHTGVNDLKQFSSLGVVEPSTEYDLKDYVPVTANTDYRLSQPAAPYGQRICFFDADKNPLGRFNQAGGGAITTPVQDFRTPSNCAFVGLYHRVITGNVVYNYVLTPLNVLHIENASGSYSYPVKNLTDSPYEYRIQDIESDLIAIEAAIGSHQTQITTASSKADGAQGALLAQQNQIDDLNDTLGGFAPNPITPYYLARPGSGRVSFSVPVNCSIPDVDSQTLLKQDDSVVHYDWGLLFLPTNYTQAGKPVRLIISCHGSGIWIGPSSTIISGDFAFLLSQGYAVMDMNGIPATLAGTTPDVDNNARHYGAPFALQSYLKGYEFVVNTYNVAKDGCFVLGTSMGGMSSFMLVNSGSIPVLAQGAFCPVVDLFKQAYVNPWNAAAQRAAIASHYGFTGTAPTFTATVPPTQPEIDYFIANISKVIGYENMLKRTIAADYASMYSVIPASGLTESAPEQTEYNKYSKLHPVPLKIWHCKDDTTVRWRYSKYFTEMVKRTGGLAVLRTFPSGGHAAWDTGETITGIPTVAGGTTSTKACTYELVLWFGRFDK